jgi:L-aspartate oxidase
LWGVTTNAPGATADGIMLALFAGAQVADLEFMQFHPTALDDGLPTQRVLLTEALRGHGATLVDAHGERFVDELAPRHIVAHAILSRPRAFLDCRHIVDLERYFPTVVAAARHRGFDPVTELLPVAPAAHYFIGGVAADAFGRTSIDALSAAGECAATGMHGANRLAGNSLLETVVVGRRVGARVAIGSAASDAWTGGTALAPTTSLPPDPRIAEILWRGVGPIRDEDGLARAMGELSTVADTGHRELAQMIARAARARLESRGVHIRSDFPDQDPGMASRSFDQRVAH